jgi:hypothetical protein
VTLRDRIPVEPLSEERLDRLEQRIVRAAAPALARPARHPLWPWGLALASAAAAALAVYALRPVPPAPHAPAFVVSTDEGATLELGEASIRVAPHTRFDVSRAGGGIDVRLDHGSVSLDVAPRRGRPPLWVHAGDVGVRVVGTAFTVTRAPGAGEVGVEVEHGTVEVHREGQIAAVTGGQRWSSRDGTVIAMAKPVPAPVPAPGAVSAPDPAGPGRIGAAGSHTPALATGPEVGGDVAVLEGRRGSSPGSIPGGSATAGGRTGSRRTGDPKPVTPPAPDPIGDLIRDIYAQDVAPGVAADGATPEERVAALRKRSAEGKGDDASAALYSLARTQHIELRKHRDALRTIDMYMTRFPRGAEREAAMWLRLRLLCGSKITDACREAAHAYIQTSSGAGMIERRVNLAGRVTNVR